MLIEIYEYLQEYFRASPYLRKTSLIQELIAIKSRAKRCKQAWQAHLDNSKRFIVEHACDFPKTSQVLVCGAGLLNDLPLDFLSQNFAQVFLLDIYFLQTTLKQLRQYPNIKIIHYDLTSRIISKQEDLSDLHFDLVISLNVLSQLPLYLPSIQAKQIILEHLNWLENYQQNNKKIILITDYIKQVFDKSNNLQLEESSLCDIDLPLAKSYWDWSLAPLGEIDPNYSLKLKIAGIVYSN